MVNGSSGNLNSDISFLSADTRTSVFTRDYPGKMKKTNTYPTKTDATKNSTLSCSMMENKTIGFWKSKF
ncbi:MAG: hypothetical protein B6D34_09055 [Candidatus Brocadia sp. UTAMX1]|jgi:hypothetical protein|nr:MAG: hypothetical protein B6D34_09055 [Candidatus Brocadia sp. UTAMX1]